MTDKQILKIANDLSTAERKAIMHREGGSEACMSWEVAHSLYDRGLTLRTARFLRLTWLGAKVRAELQAANAVAHPPMMREKD